MNERYGEIQANAAYPAKEFCRRVGMSRDRLRCYVPVRVVAGKPYILGSDFIDYLKRQPKVMPRKRPGREAGSFQETVLGIVSDDTSA